MKRLVFFLLMSIWSNGLCPYVCAQGSASPYVNAEITRAQFSTITTAEMDELRQKKILLVSRSFGLNLVDGLARVTTTDPEADPKYEFLNGYVKYDLFWDSQYGNDVQNLPEDPFSANRFVQIMCDPNFDFGENVSVRLQQLEEMLDVAPQSYAADVDVVILFYHTADNATVDGYIEYMDRLKERHPDIKFVFVTSGLSGPGYSAQNQGSMLFSDSVRLHYKDQVPLYDLNYLLNRDRDSGGVLHPNTTNPPEQYGLTDPVGLHPDGAYGEGIMGKAFLVMLRELYFSGDCSSSAPPSVPTNLAAELSELTVDLVWTESSHPECGVDYYEIRRNGGTIASPTTASYVDTELNPQTQYSYDVRAVSLVLSQELIVG